MPALQCTGCEALVPRAELLPFSCRNRGEGAADHVLRLQRAPAWTMDADSDNPFVRYRQRSYSHQVALAGGLSDARFVQIVEELSAAIAAVDRPVAISPLVESSALSVFVKDETRNVSGSHKARHLIGTAIHLAIAQTLGAACEAPLAIASCGNAALAAAVVAKAAQRELRVFVPTWADAAVLARLRELGAEILVCERRSSDPPGDPCYLRFREAVSAGALPFSCQGSDNALALIGGHSLGWELLEQSAEAPFTDIFVQVGGGALASSLMQAFAMARTVGAIQTVPRFHAIQTDNAHPLARAWTKLQASGGNLEHARLHRSEYMWPWESEPKSVASGILDDETYDWYSIVQGLQESGGSVITVSEQRLIEARERAEAETGIAVDFTGAAGLAGLLELRARDVVETDGPSLVLFTGALR